MPLEKLVNGQENVSSEFLETKPMFPPRITFGQGKTATVLLTGDGCYYPVIHEPYSHRAYYKQHRFQSVPAIPRRGDRPMHQTTLTLAKPPWAPDYVTTNKLYLSGSKTLQPVQRPTPSPSMQTSQIKFGNSEEPNHFSSSHTVAYYQKELIPANQLHRLFVINKLNHMEGAKVKEVMTPDQGPASYWTQYNRIHNKLGLLRGPGVARGYPIRQQFDIITGEEKGPAWKPDNARVSGNRMLHSVRKELTF